MAFTRDPEGAWLGGVCSGLARALGLHPLLVRLIFVALMWAGGTGGVLYLALWLLMPLPGEAWRSARTRGRGRTEIARTLRRGVERLRRRRLPLR